MFIVRQIFQKFFKMVRHIGFSENIINIIKNKYKNIKCCGKVDGNLRERFYYSCFKSDLTYFPAQAQKIKKSTPKKLSDISRNGNF